MAFFRIENGWPVAVPKAQWTDTDWEVFLGCGGNSVILDNELCRLLDEARRLGYERAQIEQSRYGWALYTRPGATGRISAFFRTQADAVVYAQQWAAENPGFRTIISLT